MFVKKVFQLVKPFLANLHYTISKKYSYTEVGSAIFFGGALSLECYLFLYVR
jgi:hypothetical protein